MQKGLKIGVIIPCYRVRSHILGVLEAIPAYCDAIYIVDDCCPENTGQLVETHTTDPRVKVIHHTANRGVGGAALTGMVVAAKDGMSILVKLDGDGQMNPAQIRRLVAPIANGECDYAKGNRFFNLKDLAGMPLNRRIGNAILSFVSKLSSGYWPIFDPTNGFIAIHAEVFKRLDIEEIAENYFFESDMLFQLNMLRAVVSDIPMRAIYANEISNFKAKRFAFYFMRKHVHNFLTRIFYTYLIRDFSMASVYLLLGPPLIAFGMIFGIDRWITLSLAGLPATAGTVMLATLPVLLGFQILLSFISFDIGNVPRQPLHRLLEEEVL